jgi:hypothetical protein
MRRERGPQPWDGKVKDPPAAGRTLLDGLANSGVAEELPAGAFTRNTRDSNACSASSRIGIVKATAMLTLLAARNPESWR